MKLEEIARLAGVSLSTVSYALSGKGNVSADTRGRVREIAEKCGYRPHGPAQSLSTGKTSLVGIASALLEGVPISFSESQVLAGLAQVLSGEGLSVVLFSEEAREGVPKTLAQQTVGGAVFLTRPRPLLAQWLRSRSVPCVAVNLERIEAMDIVRPDDDGGVHQAVEHLAQLGHRRIAYVNTFLPSVKGHPTSIEARQTAFLKTTAERDMIAAAGTQSHWDVTERIGMLIADDSPPTAFLCYNDHVAALVIDDLHQRGLRVPQDASVLGVDDIVADRTSPPLTSVSVPWTQMGHRAGELLLARVAAPDRPFEDIELPERLVIRRSTGPAP